MEYFQRNQSKPQKWQVIRTEYLIQWLNQIFPAIDNEESGEAHKCTPGKKAHFCKKGFEDVHGAVEECVGINKGDP